MCFFPCVPQMVPFLNPRREFGLSTISLWRLDCSPAAWKAVTITGDYMCLY